MSESFKEQRPLLCEDLSDEEIYRQLHSPYQRRTENRGRAKNKVKGTAAILAAWPDQWSYLAHIWLILGLSALVIMIVYNVLIALYILPSADARTKNHNPRHIFNIDSSRNSKLPEVSMHLFSENNKEIDYNKYMPYIEIITKKYPDFQYNFYIVLNDTSDEETLHNRAEENNELALDSVLSDKKIDYKPMEKLKIVNMESISLSRFMDVSPLRTQWRRIPEQYMPFLVRAISVWDRGGIAIDPIIFTPDSPNSVYFEKVKNILEKYAGRKNMKKKEKGNAEIKTKEITLIKLVSITSLQTEPKKKLNNIQEILEALESDDGINNHSQNNLTEAETRDADILVSNRRKLLSYIEPNNETSITTAKHTIENSTSEKQVSKSNMEIPDIYSQSNLKEKSNVTKNLGMYSFFDYMFRRRHLSNWTDSRNDNTIIKRDIPDVNLGNNYSNTKQFKDKINKPLVITNNIELKEKYKPMIISADEKYPKPLKVSKFNLSSEYENIDTLTVDLKGYIVATETACHAFIGNIFSAIVHHTTEETLTDFLIAQLSIFCKGLLSTCKGLDIIIL